MSAIEHMSLEQFKNVRSQDYPGKTIGQVESEGLLDERTSRWTETPENPVGYNDRLKGISDSVKEHGIKEPVWLSVFKSQSGEESTSLWEGHHRGVAAIRHGVDPVPVRRYPMEDLIRGEMR